MWHNLFSLALQGLKRKGKQGFLLFFILFLSFAAVIVSISSMASISKTNTEHRLDVYGRWCLAIPSGKEEDRGWLESKDWAQVIGETQLYGTVPAGNKSVGFGTMDSTYISIGRIEISEGEWPIADDEIVLDPSTLNALGYEPIIGEKVSLPVKICVGDTLISVQKTYTLCGIIEAYSSLWSLDPNPDSISLVGAVVSKSGAERMLTVAQAQVTDRNLEITPIPQYFIYTDAETRDAAYEETKIWMRESRNNTTLTPCKNLNAYPQSGLAAPETYYTYAIAAVTAITVLCAYLILLPSEIRSFSILRCVGITRGQMGLLMEMEALMICVPAIVLGIPVGAGLTWLVLYLQRYADSVPVQIAIPYKTLLLIILLWIAMVLVSRWIVYIIASHSPLSGRMQGTSRKYRRIGRFQSGLIILLVTLFGAVVIYTATELPYPKTTKYLIDKQPSYYIHSSYNPDISEPLFTEEDIELIEQVPGIQLAYGINRGLQQPVYIKGIEDKQAMMVVLDSEHFEEALHFGKDAEAFENGNLVLMCFPDVNDEAYHLTGMYQADETYVFPEGDVQFLIYDQDGNVVIESEPTSVCIRWIPRNVISRSVVFSTPYTIVCSENYMKRLIADLEEGETWGVYSGGKHFGYNEISAYADADAVNLSTDKALNAILKSLNKGATIDNRREEYQQQSQLLLQESILLYCVGICVCIVLLFILSSTSSLEAEHELRYYTTMRTIGMSYRQMLGRILLKVLKRGAVAVLAGWLVFGGYTAVSALSAENTFLTVLSEKWVLWKYSGFDFRFCIGVSVLCLVIPVAVLLIAKRKLIKGVKAI